MAKKEQKVILADFKKVEEYLQKSRAEFEKRIEIEKERERKTMEKGLVYLINT
jgi:hypothetical protein